MVQYKRSRWTRMEHEVLREFIERDSRMRPLGRCVRCCKCCYKPECAQLTYLMCGVVLFLGMALLVAFYILLIHPTIEGALYADKFQPATCRTINSTYLREKKSCNCGHNCWRNYPCLAIHVFVNPHTYTNHLEKYKPLQSNLYDSTRTVRFSRCAYTPVECAPYTYLMEQEIERFKIDYGEEDTTYQCLHNPGEPSAVVLERENFWQSIHYLHFIVWPGVVVGFSLLFILLAYSICGCMPYVCFRRVPSDVRDEAHSREAEIALKAKNIETCRTIPDFSAGTLPLKKPYDEIQWKQYDYYDTADAV